MPVLAPNTPRPAEVAKAVETLQTATASSKISRAELDTVLQANGAKEPKTDQLASAAPTTTASTSTNTTTTWVTPQPAASDVAKDSAFALDANKRMDLRVQAYNRLPEHAQKDIYSKLSEKDRGNFTAPASDLDKQALAQVRDATNSDMYRGKKFTELSPDQQRAIGKELGVAQARKLIEAYERDLHDRKAGRHTKEEKAGFAAEAAAIKSAKKEMESIEDQKSFGERVKEKAPDFEIDRGGLKIGKFKIPIPGR